MMMHPIHQAALTFTVRFVLFLMQPPHTHIHTQKATYDVRNDCFKTIVVVDRFCTALFSTLEQTHCALVECDCCFLVVVSSSSSSSSLLSCSQYLTMRGCHADTKRRQNHVTSTYVSQTRPTSMSVDDLRLLGSGSSLTRTAGVAQWLECRTRDRKVAGSSPSTSDGRIFFSRVNSLCRH